jgi:uncharacterized protein (DUF885 family)
MKYFFPLLFALVITGCRQAPENDDAAFLALLDRIWEWNLEVHPEMGTYKGIPGTEDRWTDRSLEAIEARKQKTHYWFEQLQKLEGLSLSPARRLEYELLIDSYERSIEGQQFPFEWLAINQMGGVQHGPASTLKMMSRTSVEDYGHILARLEKLPEVVDQTRTLLRIGLEKKVTPPRIVLRDVPNQIAVYLEDDIIANPLWVPFQEMPEDVSAEEADPIRAQARSLILGPVRDAYRKLHRFLVEEYLPNALEEVGIDELPDGGRWYAYMVQSSTTTDFSPAEIHEIGKNEVARIHEEMLALAQKNGHPDIRGYDRELRDNPEYDFASKEDLLKEYRALCKRIDATLAQFIGTLPRLPYGIELIPEHAEKSAPAAYYQAGAIRTGRPGIFYVNGYNLPDRAAWEMEALALHETVPGHHLQIARAQELEDKHELLKGMGYTAYAEGWALYCEKLGREMGFYQTDATEFGRLNFEIWRAIRLVVDTGLHSMNWSRQQAIDYFLKYSAKDGKDIEVEVDRYLVWPAQALSYKIGELRFLALREIAEAELGDHFDIREFHDILLGKGALPLDILEEQVRSWIEKKASESH